MVGLPARGKTYVARKVAHFLRWRGYNARVFNVGQYRRERVGASVSHAFFDPLNSEGLEARRQVAHEALDDLLTWMSEGGQVGIYDATNSTRTRRQWVKRRFQNAGVQVLWIEIVCDDPEQLDANIRETKLSSPDYAHTDAEQAMADFRARIAHYEQAYEPVEEDEGPMVRQVDAGRQLTVREVQGYLPSLLVNWILNLHLVPRPIYLTRHGESVHNHLGLIGGDPPLTQAGREYARALGLWLGERETQPVVWTSTLQRTHQTAAFLPWSSLQVRALDEIDAGTCDGLTYEQVARRMPDEFEARQADKLRYRYPRGESYEDVILRVEPIIFELERQRGSVIVIAHQAVLRTLYAYLAGRSRQDCPHLDLPLHTVIRLVPRAYGCHEERFVLG
jgi:broad specificity phosphatase PhoE/predicted kinase